jgi:hypothetical protein
MSATQVRKMDIYKNVHKALRFLMFRVSVSMGKYDPAIDSNLSHIKADFDDLSGWLKEHAVHEDTFFHTLIEKKHPATVAALENQHAQSESDWREVEEDADRIFGSSQMPDSADWHRFYLKFNQFVTSYLTHLQYEELVALPILWECASDEEIMIGLQGMFKSFTPKTMERSKKWLLQSCNLSELKEMRYVP